MAATLPAVASGALAGYQIMLARGTTWSLWLTTATLLAGCGSRAEIVLLQPEPGRPARELRIASEWASFHATDDTDRLLLGWPLPGARGGRRVFELYLRLPQGNGSFSAKASEEGSPAVTGLFYQNAGRRAGRTHLVDGTVTVTGSRGGGAEWREGTFDLACRDGTRLVGRFRAKRSRILLMSFEDRHAADIRDLLTGSEGSARLATNLPDTEVNPSPASDAVEGRPSTGTP